MKVGVYSIRDMKAGSFMAPFFLHNDEVAKRAAREAVRDPQSNFSKYPEDFTLFRIGIFDDSTGLVEPEVAPSLVCSLFELTVTPVAEDN